MGRCESEPPGQTGRRAENRETDNNYNYDYNDDDDSETSGCRDDTEAQLGDTTSWEARAAKSLHH